MEGVLSRQSKSDESNNEMKYSLLKKRSKGVGEKYNKNQKRDYSESKSR